MNLLDLTFPTPAGNLACDEALLDSCESEGGPEILRFWEPKDYFIVVGYANRVASEVNRVGCAAAGIPVFRRCSGGGTVLQGPGCLNYTLILKTAGPLGNITSANQFIMERHRAAIESEIRSQIPGLQAAVAVRGYTDLTLQTLPAAPRKFSGNAQRRKKEFLLFHGTFLLEFDSPLIEKVLAMPSRQPDYRQGRSHADFLVRLPLAPESVKGALRKIWAANEKFEKTLSPMVELLARNKYASPSWNSKF